MYLFDDHLSYPSVLSSRTAVNFSMIHLFRCLSGTLTSPGLNSPEGGRKVTPPAPGMVSFQMETQEPKLNYIEYKDGFQWSFEFIGSVC